MGQVAQLDQLNLDSAAKPQVAALVQALLGQAAHDAKTIQAKDLKIQALTHELAHIRRIRYGVKSEPYPPCSGTCSRTLLPRASPPSKWKSSNFKTMPLAGQP